MKKQFKKPRIMILTDAYPPDGRGGAALIPYYQAIGLTNRGWNVGVITSCLEKSNHKTGMLLEEGISVYRLFSLRPLMESHTPSSFTNAIQIGLTLTNPLMTKPIQDAIDNFQPDLIHGHHIPRISYRTFRALSPDKPKILTFHTYHYECPKGGLFRKYRQQVCNKKPLPCGFYQDQVKLALENTNGVIAISNFIKKRLISSGYPAKQIHYIPNGVPDLDTRRYTPPSDNKDILYVGRLDHNKGVSDLLRAFQTIKDRQTKLIIVGDGPIRASLETVARNDPRIIFLGWLSPPQVADWYRKSRIVAVPSIWHEVMNTVICEAQSWGRAVVATTLGGNSDMIEHQKDGVLFEPNDVTALASALNQLVTSDTMVDLLGQNAFKSIRRFDINHHLDALEKLYFTMN